MATVVKRKFIFIKITIFKLNTWNYFRTLYKKKALAMWSIKFFLLISIFCLKSYRRKTNCLIFNILFFKSYSRYNVLIINCVCESVRLNVTMVKICKQGTEWGLWKSETQKERPLTLLGAAYFLHTKGLGGTIVPDPIQLLKE